MTFNRTYLLEFGPAYFRRLEEHLARKEMSTSITAPAPRRCGRLERPEEFGHTPTDNYGYMSAASRK